MRHNRVVRRLATGVFTSLVGLAIVPAALAGANDGHNGAGEQVQSGVQGAENGVAGGTLPFTGSELTAIVVVAILLAVTGLVLRRATRTQMP
ncbi:MAG: hypothetical protein QOI67_955 [Gaiellaceae bacterium]|jgi:hypothetical protein|nr:hypothetical protein [Gaiellaceae bacterium]